MNLIRKLAWFFKLEKRRYIIGILALSLVSVFNLIPPRVIGQVEEDREHRPHPGHPGQQSAPGAQVPPARLGGGSLRDGWQFSG